MKFRKKPVIIEAEQFTAVQPWPAGVCDCFNDVAHPGPHIHSLEGVMDVSQRDWVITGVKGERYPCKPDVFKCTYERVISVEEAVANILPREEPNERPV